MADVDQEGMAQALKGALLLDHSDDAYMDETDDVSSFLIDGRIDLNFIAAQLEPLLVNAKAAGREQGLREAAEVARTFNVTDVGQTFVEPDDIAAAIKALLSEKPA